MADPPGETVTSGQNDKLAKLLHAFATGKRPVKDDRDAHQYLKAILGQVDHALCIEKVACSTTTLHALCRGLRSDTTTDFLNNSFTGLLTYLSVPEVKRLCNGECLRLVLRELTSPASLWNALVKAYEGHQLSAPATLSFAWLLVELLSWVVDGPVDVGPLARQVTDARSSLDSHDRQLRAAGCRIESHFQAKSSGLAIQAGGPGGRHDNDFTDFRQVQLFPTQDELTSKQPPFYSMASTLLETPVEARVAHHLDNQFRLLREDLLGELRDGLLATTRNKSTRAKTKLVGLSFQGVFTGHEKKRLPAAVAVCVNKGLGAFPDLTDKRKYLRTTPGFLKQGTFGYFIHDGAIVASGTIERVEDLLCEPNPRIVIRVTDKPALAKVLYLLAVSREVDFSLSDVPTFAYEPVLRCLQTKTELPLWRSLLCPDQQESEPSVDDVSAKLLGTADKIESDDGQGLDSVLALHKPIDLDTSQMRSLLSALRQPVALVQGPPGTGKSFIGALLAKILHDDTREDILVICYTNHALDQFLEDLMDIGIPQSSMVRLGSKSTARTEPLSLRNQANFQSRARQDWDAINQLNAECVINSTSLSRHVDSFKACRASGQQLLDHLEFSADPADHDYFEAFTVPEAEHGYQIAGKDGHAISGNYLVDRWVNGDDAGVIHRQVSKRHQQVWATSLEARLAKLMSWEKAMLTELAENVIAAADVCDKTQRTLAEVWSRRETQVLQQKRIVACTTTGAAMYCRQLEAAAPSTVLVEEAGEILESHIITAMPTLTKKLSSSETTSSCVLRSVIMHFLSRKAMDST